MEYGDYECPYCGHYGLSHRPGKFRSSLENASRLVFRNFPLSEMHPHAEAAAEVAEFAGAQGQVLQEMHDKL